MDAGLGLEPVSVARTALKVAAGLGLEPRSDPSKGSVLPLDDPASVFTSSGKVPQWLILLVIEG